MKSRGPPVAKKQRPEEKSQKKKRVRVPPQQKDGTSLNSSLLGKESLTDGGRKIGNSGVVLEKLV